MTHAAGGTGARPKGSHAWLQGLACGALLAFAPSFALLLAVLLAPAIAASLLDRRPHHPVARAVALASGAFTLGPVWRLATGGHSLGAALDLLADPLVIGLAWLAGACGWALCVLLPVVLRAASDVRAAARIAALQAEAEALRAAWDLDRPA
jgi:hypothetical protein